MTESRIKTHRSGVVVAGELDTIEEILDRMANQNLGSIVVVRDNRVCGIFTERDLLRKWRTILNVSSLKKPIREIMTSPVFTITLKEIAQAPAAMYQKRIRHIPVVDKEQHLLGIISARDVLATAAKGEPPVKTGVAADPSKRVLHLIAPEIGLASLVQELLSSSWTIKIHQRVDKLLDPTYWESQGEHQEVALFVDLDGLQSHEWKPLVRQLITLLTKEKQPRVSILWSPGRVGDKDMEVLRTIAKTAEWHAYERPVALGPLIEDLRNFSQ